MLMRDLEKIKEVNEMIGKLLNMFKVKQTDKNSVIPLELKDVRFGLIKDKEDNRDYIFATDGEVVKLPTKVDLREYCSNIKQQGSMNSCTGFALMSSLEMQKNKLKDPVDFSELFVYYNERKIMGWQTKDQGACLRDGCYSLTKEGAALEQFWPYLYTKVFEEPSWIAYFCARYFRIKSYYRVMDGNAIKTALKDGNAVVFGMMVYKNFWSYKTGVYKDYTGGQLGGHAMCLVGYDDDKNAYLVRNSWGNSWGEYGYGWIDYNTFDKHLMDAWVIVYR